MWRDHWSKVAPTRRENGISNALRLTTIHITSLVLPIDRASLSAPFRCWRMRPSSVGHNSTTGSDPNMGGGNNRVVKLLKAFGFLGCEICWSNSRCPIKLRITRASVLAIRVGAIELLRRTSMHLVRVAGVTLFDNKGQ